MKVFITRDIPEVAVDYLKKKKFDVKIFERKSPISKSRLLKEVEKIDALISLVTDKIDAEIIDAMQKCKVIANYAVGYNNIDYQYAKKKNIIVTNTPDVLTDSTADLTMALALSCARRLYEGKNLIEKNKFSGWHPKLLLGIELKDKTFGILGAGRIGTAVAIRAKSFGTKIMYYSNHKNTYLDDNLNAKKVSLDKLLKSADFLSINLPLTKNTYHLLDSKKLDLLKKTVVIINTARGEIIDENALIRIIRNKKIFAAGLDVFENEPRVNKKLLKLDNVVILPHIGSATVEARDKMAMLAARNVSAVLRGKKPVTPI